MMFGKAPCSLSVKIARCKPGMAAIFFPPVGGLYHLTSNKHIFCQAPSTSFSEAASSQHTWLRRLCNLQPVRLAWRPNDAGRQHRQKRHATSFYWQLKAPLFQGCRIICREKIISSNQTGGMLCWCRLLDVAATLGWYLLVQYPQYFGVETLLKQQLWCYSNEWSNRGFKLKICCCKIKASETPTPFLGYEGLESLVTGRGKKKSPHRKVPEVIFNAKWGYK